MHKEDSQEGLHQDRVQITLEEETHTYRVDGKVLPSVSEIMREASENHYAAIPIATLEKAADRGKRVHRAVEMFERFGIEPEDDEIKPYFIQYRIAKRLEGFEVLESELMMTNGEYCGTIDILANLKGFTTLIDIKATAKINDDLLEVQLAAYDKLLVHNDKTPMAHYCLQLKTNGYKFKAIEPNEMLWEDYLEKHRNRNR